MTVDPSTAAMEDVFRGFDDAIIELTNAVARLKVEIAEHPRYNDKSDRIRTMLGILQNATAAAKSFVDAYDDRGARVGELIDLVRKLACNVNDLANENAAHPASLIGKPVQRVEGNS